MGDDSNQHVFLVLNCPETFITPDGNQIDLKEGEAIDIEVLPNEALILDLWTRCKFKPSQAREYWKQAMSLFDWGNNFSCKQVSYMDGSQFKAEKGHDVRNRPPF